MSRSSIFLAAGLLVSACLGWEVCRAQGQGLAERQPNAALFLKMAVRGGYDFYVVNRRPAGSLSELVAAGYTAYQVPAAASFTFSSTPRRVEALSPTPVFIGGRTDGLRREGRGLPDLSRLKSTTNLPASAGAPALSYEAYDFDGAALIEAGLSGTELDLALRRKRLVLHLAWATFEFALENGRLPQDLSALEDYVGAPRNPAGWAGIQVVSALSQVDAAPGNLYVGSSPEASWVVAVNLGHETFLIPFKQHPQLGWAPVGTLVY